MEVILSKFGKVAPIKWFRRGGSSGVLAYLNVEEGYFQLYFWNTWNFCVKLLRKKPCICLVPRSLHAALLPTGLTETGSTVSNGVMEHFVIHCLVSSTFLLQGNPDFLTDMKPKISRKPHAKGFSLWRALYYPIVRAIAKIGFSHPTLQQQKVWTTGPYPEILSVIIHNIGLLLIKNCPICFESFQN